MNKNELNEKENPHYDSQIKWYGKKEVLSLFPITERTYFRRIKDLPETIRIQKRKNKRGRPSLYIHYKDLPILFEEKRSPVSLGNKDVRRKYIGTKNWDFIGNIVPECGSLVEIQEKMRFIFHWIQKKDKSAELFYSCEQNPNDENIHSHFLIKGNLKKKEIQEILELVCESNTTRQTRIFLQKYNYDKYHYSGSFYSFKTTNKDKGISLFDEFLNHSNPL